MKENSKLIFISHAYADKVIVDKIIDKLLTSIFYIDKTKDIFYTSKRETGISSRSKWKETIKTNLKNSKIFIAIITSNFKKSEMCLGEVGAAWVLNKKIFTLILPPIKHESSNILLAEFQSDNLLKNSDVISFIRAITKDLQIIKSVGVKADVDIENIVFKFTKSIGSYLRRNPIHNENVVPISEIVMPPTTHKGKEQFDIFNSPSIPEDVIEHVKSVGKEKYPADYSMQEYHLEEQIKAINELKSLRNIIINKPEKLAILDRAIKKYPNDYEMQVYEAKEQITSFDRLEKEKFVNSRKSIPKIIIGKRQSKNNY